MSNENINAFFYFLCFCSVVVFYNSLAQHRKELIRLHVSSPNVVVTDSDGNAIESQANILWETAEHSFSGTYEVRKV